MMQSPSDPCPILHNWVILPATDGLEQECASCGKHRRTPEEDKWWIKKSEPKPNDPPYKIGIPPGTRLIGLTRHNNAWQLWLAVKNKADNPSEWVGTYLLCHDDGSVLRIQNDIEPEEVFHVKTSDTSS